MTCLSLTRSPQLAASSPEARRDGRHLRQHSSSLFPCGPASPLRRLERPSTRTAAAIAVMEPEQSGQSHPNAIHTVGVPRRDPYGLPNYPQRPSSPPAMRRVRTLVGESAIPADSKEFVVAGNCEVQLDDELVVGMAAMGRTQCCMMTIKWLRAGGDGEDECTYEEWREARTAGRVDGRPTEESRACNLDGVDGSTGGGDGRPIPNRIALVGNCVKLVAYAAGKHHAISLYQRLPTHFSVTGFAKELL